MGKASVTEEAPEYNENLSKWKWLVLAASFCTHILVYGIAWGAGVFQMMFMDVFGGEGKAGFVSIIPTLVASCLCFIGPVVSVFINRLGCRIVTGLGSVFMSLGFVLSSFATSVWFLYGTFAIIGVGCGLAFIPSVVIVCDYFHQKRPLAVAVASSGLGIGIFIVPPLVRMLDNFFNWQGALLILGAITLNASVSAAIYRPLPRKPHVDPASASRKRKILRVKMLKEIPFLCFILNQVMCLYGMVAFYIHLPAHVQQQGYSEDEAALFISVTGAATMISRVLCGVVIQKINSPISIYATSMAAGAVAVFSVPFSHSTPQLFAACLVFGLGTATLGPSVPLILAQLVGVEAIGDGYGYIMVAEGIGSIIGPPVSGFLFDASNSYVVSICVAGSMMFIGSLLMLVPIYTERKKRELDRLVQESITGANPSDPRRYFRNLSQRPLLMPSFSESPSAFWEVDKRSSQEMEEIYRLPVGKGVPGNWYLDEAFEASTAEIRDCETQIVTDNATVKAERIKPLVDGADKIGCVENPGGGEEVSQEDVHPTVPDKEPEVWSPAPVYVDHPYPCAIEAAIMAREDTAMEDTSAIGVCSVPIFHLNNE